MILLRTLFTIALLGLAGPVIAASGASPTGKFVPGHLLRSNTTSGSPYSDAGGAAGSTKLGQGYVTEMNITNTGLPFAIYDDLTTNAHHRLMLGANSSGAGYLTFDAGGGANPLPFNFVLEGNNVFHLDSTGAYTTSPPGGDSSFRIPTTAWVQGLTTAAGTAGIINVKAGPFNAKGDGVTDDAAAINSAIAAAGTGAVVTFPPGTYAIGSPIYPPSNSFFLFAGGAELKKLSDGYCAVEPVDAVGHTYPQDSVTGLRMLNLSVNNNHKTGCALMLDSVRGGQIDINTLYGGADTGTWTYTDNYGTGSYQNALLMLKGTFNVDNTASTAIRINNIGNILRPSYTCDGYSQAGIWFGASAGDTTAHNPPNNNQIFSGQIYCNRDAVDLDYGSDNSFYSVDFSLNSGWVAKIGNGVTSYRANRRNAFYKPYMEANGVGGIYLASNASYNTVYDPASTAGTPVTALFDNTHGGSNNLWCDSKQCYRDTQTWVSRAPVGTTIMPGISNQGELYDAADNQGADIMRRGWGNSSALLMTRIDGTHAAPTAVQDNEQIGEVGARAYDGTAVVSSRQVGTRYVASGAQTPTSHAAWQRWFVTDNGSTTSVDAMALYPNGGLTLGSSGSLGLGTLNAQNGVYDNSVRLYSACGAFSNQNSSFTVSGATHGQLFRVNANTPITATLPPTPFDGEDYCFEDQRGLAATNNITIAGNGKLVAGGSSFVMNNNFEFIHVSYSAATDSWIPLSNKSASSSGTGTPGGSDGQIQYRVNSTTFGGRATSGVGTTVVTTTGTQISGHCVSIDANGDHVDAGVVCGGGGGGSGTVTSVGLSVPATSIFSVTGSPVTTTGTLALATTGTSGGIPYFSSGTQLASSGALTAGLPIIGGGAGVAPSPGAKSGNTTTFVTTTGTQTSGHCVSIDANGNHVDSGVVGCGSGGVTTNGVLNDILTSNGAGGFGTPITPATGIAAFLAAPTSANLRAALTDEVGTGAAYFVGGALGTPASATLTNATGLPISTGVSGLGTSVAAWLATPSSANLAAAVTGETGSGALVFGTAPALSGVTLSDVTGSTQCLHVSTLGVITGTGSDCGAGGGASPTIADTHSHSYTTPTQLSFASGFVISGANGSTVTISQTNEITSSSAASYTLAGTDAGTTVHLTNASAVPVSVTSGATLGNGYSASVQSDAGSTFTPAAGTINGAATLVTAAHQTALIWSDGTTTLSGGIIPATDPSNATNLISGTVPAARLPSIDCATLTCTNFSNRVTFGWIAGADIATYSSPIYTAEATTTVLSVRGRVSNPAGGTATVAIYKAPNGTACPSGTAQTTASFDANGTANTNQVLTLVGGAANVLAAGDSLCAVGTGSFSTLAAAGEITIKIQVQ